MKKAKVYIFDLSKSAKHKGCWTDPIGFTLQAFLNLTYGYKIGKKMEYICNGIYKYRFYDSSQHNKRLNIICYRNPGLKNWIVTGACYCHELYKEKEADYIAVYVKPSK